MIRQSQNYFAAALSAAVLNAAAIAAFVVFTMLSAAGGFPLQDLLGLGNTVTPASSSSPSGDGEAPRKDGFIPGGGFSSTSPVGTSAGSGGGAAATATIDQPNGSGPRSAGSGPSDGDAGFVPGSGSGAAGGGAAGGSAGGGGIGTGGDTPTTPSGAAQQIGGAVFQVPSALNQTVNSAVDAADDVTSGGLSQSGASQAVQGASNSLLGPGSAVDQAAGGVGSALGASNRIAPEAPVSTPALG